MADEPQESKGRTEDDEHPRKLPYWDRAMNVTLPPELENFVREEVKRGNYGSEEDVLKEALHLMLKRRSDTTQSGEAEANTVQSGRAKPIWEVAADLRKTVPASEWEKLPTDGAEQLDHYIHGSPKRTS